MNKFKQDIYQLRFAIIPVSLYLIITQIIFGFVCPFRLLFDIECPGCGLTRATLELFKGNFIEAIHYNFTVFYWLIFILLFIIDRYIKKLPFKPFPDLFIIAAILTILRYILVLIN